MKILAIAVLWIVMILGYEANAQISSFNVQLLSKPDAAADRAYLGITNAPWGTNYVLRQVQFVPTNSIPTSSVGITNWIFCNVSNYGPVLIATNTAASGYQKILMNAPSAL